MPDSKKAEASPPPPPRGEQRLGAIGEGLRQRQRLREALRGRLAAAAQRLHHLLRSRAGVLEQPHLRDQFAGFGRVDLASAQQRRATTTKLAERFRPGHEWLDGQVHEVEGRRLGFEQQAARFRAPGEQLAQGGHLFGMQPEARCGIARHVAVGELRKRAVDRLPGCEQSAAGLRQQAGVQRLTRRLQCRTGVGECRVGGGVAGQRAVDQAAVLLGLHDHVERQPDQRHAFGFGARGLEIAVRRPQRLRRQPRQRQQQHHRHQRHLGRELQLPHQLHAGLHEQDDGGMREEAHV
ncbi:MAG: hypothetical protein IPP50_21840 [Piscinibacter sp.]|nr:hypothetical protein [Piscinibacter sp.]